MMKHFSRALSLALAVIFIMTMGVTAFAKKADGYVSTPNDVNYEINVDGEKLTLLSNRKGPQKFSIKDGKISFRVDDTGLVLSFETKSNNDKDVILGKDVKQFKITGNVAALALTDTLDYKYHAKVEAEVNWLTVMGSCKVSIGENASVNNLGIHNNDAEVVYADGAFIAKENKAPATRTKLEMAIRDYNYYTAHASYDNVEKTVTLPCTMPGCTVKDAMKDVILKVCEVNGGDSVSGRWFWPNLNGGSTESGSYVYRFIPSDNEHEGAQITVNFISYNDNPNKF